MTTPSTRAAPAWARSSSICASSTPSRSPPSWPNPQSGEPKPLGQRLVERGIVGEHDIARAVAHRFSLELVDLRRDHTGSRRDQAARRAHGPAPGGDSLARGQRPGGRGGGGPVGSTGRRCCSRRSAAGGRPGRRALGHPRRHRQQLPGAERGHHPDPGLRGTAGAAGEARPGRAEARGVQRLRGRAGGAGRAADHHPGAARPGVGHPHRAAGRTGPGALPDRRRAARRARPAARHGSGRVQPHQDPREHEHRRAAAGPGRSDQHGARRPQRRHPGRDHRRDRGREGGAAAAGQEPLAVPARPARHAGRHDRALRRDYCARRTAW